MNPEPLTSHTGLRDACSGPAPLALTIEVLREVEMHIGLIGGVERTEPVYRAQAEARGHSLQFHSGHVHGRGTASLEQIARTADLVIVATDVNSHGAVQLARRLARREGVPMVLLRRCSPSRLAEILDELDRTGRIAS
ncbi:MAG: DUF2325 domain-containing protein [Deltaproteobacteria bacterium]|nr:DUF2325 domain-containing protein [Deltaproteobacteria bacterium]